MAARRLPIVLLLVLALAVPVAAQLPSGVPTLPPPSSLPTGSAAIEVKAAAASLEASLDRSAVTEILVTNTGEPTGTPADSTRRVVLSLSGAPAGWSPVLSQTEFQLGPGKSAKATLTVAVSAEATDPEASVTVTAKMYAPGQVGGNQLTPDSTAATVVKVVRSDSVTRDIIEKVGPYLWVVLLGLVAAVVLALSLLAANRRVAVRLSTPEAEQQVQAGGRGAFPLRVHNITRQQDTVFLRAAPLPEGWAAYLPTPQLDLEPGQQEEVSVVVIPPREAEVGARQTVDVTATSSLAPRRPATMRFEATVAQPRGKKG